MPGALKRLLQMCIKAHKKKLPDLKNVGQHPSDLISNAMSWQECLDVNKLLHGVCSSDRIDFRLGAFALQLNQGLYRQERAGKTGVCDCMRAFVRYLKPELKHRRFSMHRPRSTQESHGSSLARGQGGSVGHAWVWQALCPELVAT